MEASPSSSSYKAQRQKLANLINDSEKHFQSRDVDQSYGAELGEQINEAEEVCQQKDISDQLLLSDSRRTGPGSIVKKITSDKYAI